MISSSISSTAFSDGIFAVTFTLLKNYDGTFAVNPKRTVSNNALLNETVCFGNKKRINPKNICFFSLSKHWIYCNKSACGVNPENQIRKEVI